MSCSDEAYLAHVQSQPWTGNFIGSVAGLWLGDAQCAAHHAELRGRCITHVVVAASDSVCKEWWKHDGLVYKHIQARDRTDMDMLFYMPSVCDFIDAALALNDAGTTDLQEQVTTSTDVPLAWRHLRHQVLVHCVLGVSRSASLVAAYVMRRRQWSLEQALQDLTHWRPQARPNIGFQDQLALWHLWGFRLDPVLYARWKATPSRHTVSTRGTLQPRGTGSSGALIDLHLCLQCLPKPGMGGVLVRCRVFLILLLGLALLVLLWGPWAQRNDQTQAQAQAQAQAVALGHDDTVTKAGQNGRTFHYFTYVEGFPSQTYTSEEVVDRIAEGDDVEWDVESATAGLCASLATAAVYEYPLTVLGWTDRDTGGGRTTTGTGPAGSTRTHTHTRTRYQGRKLFAVKKYVAGVQAAQVQAHNVPSHPCPRDVTDDVVVFVEAPSVLFQLPRAEFEEEWTRMGLEGWEAAAAGRGTRARVEARAGPEARAVGAEAVEHSPLCSMMFAAGNDCFPAHLCDIYPPAALVRPHTRPAASAHADTGRHTGYRFLNAGGWVGPLGAVLRVLSAAMEDRVEWRRYTSEGLCGGPGGESGVTVPHSIFEDSPVQPSATAATVAGAGTTPEAYLCRDDHAVMAELYCASVGASARDIHNSTATNRSSDSDQPQPRPPPLHMTLDHSAHLFQTVMHEPDLVLSSRAHGRVAVENSRTGGVAAVVHFNGNSKMQGTVSFLDAAHALLQAGLGEGEHGLAQLSLSHVQRYVTVLDGELRPVTSAQWRRIGTKCKWIML